MSYIIKIPKKYWLDINKFDYKKFNYDDIECIYNSSNFLIEDFVKISGFKKYSIGLLEKYKNNRKLIKNIKSITKQNITNIT